MRIGVVCHEREEIESQSLTKAVSALGHQAAAFTLEEVEFAFDGTKLGALLGDGFDLRTLDLIISRAKISGEHALNDADRYQMLSQLSVPMSDSSTPFLRAESKLATMAVLADQGIPVLPTRICSSVDSLRQALDTFSDAVVKPSFGYGGDGVEHLGAHTPKEVLTDMLRRYGQLLVQAYIPHPEGDFRVTTAAQELLFVARRIPNARTWKANVSLGADVTIMEDPPKDVCDVGVRAARALQLFLAGVDILPVGDGYVVLEVNNCPGWTDLAEPFKAEVATRIVKRAIATAAL
jgi:ribosomal protein S6--L-glutamate ligase